MKKKEKLRPQHMRILFERFWNRCTMFPQVKVLFHVKYPSKRTACCEDIWNNPDVFLASRGEKTDLSRRRRKAGPRHDTLHLWDWRRRAHANQRLMDIFLLEWYESIQDSKWTIFLKKENLKSTALLSLVLALDVHNGWRLLPSPYNCVMSWEFSRGS